LQNPSVPRVREVEWLAAERQSPGRIRASADRGPRLSKKALFDLVTGFAVSLLITICSLRSAAQLICPTGGTTK